MSKLSPPLYTQVPHLIIRTLLPDLKEAELKALLVITDETLGWHRDETPPLSYTRIAALSGLSARAVAEAVPELQKRELVETGTVSALGTTYRLKFSESAAELDKAASPAPPAEPAARRYPGPLRERVLKQVADAKRAEIPSRELFGVIARLWASLFGEDTVPQGGKLAQMIKLYGGYEGPGAERLAVAMLNLAGRDIPGGPEQVLMSEAWKAKKGKGENAGYAPEYKETKAPAKLHLTRNGENLEGE